MEKARFIEITAISAEDLRIASRHIKKNAFMTVRTDSQNYQSTSVDRDGGSYPSWNEKLQIPLPPNARSITVEVLCKKAENFGGLTNGKVTAVLSQDSFPSSMKLREWESISK